MGILVFGWVAFFAETAFLAGAVFGTTRLGEAPRAAGAPPTFHAALFAAFLAFPERAFCAAAIFARASALTIRFAANLAAGFAGMELVALQTSSPGVVAPACA
jgi:hypothetical protein